MKLPGTPDAADAIKGILTASNKTKANARTFSALCHLSCKQREGNLLLPTQMVICA